MVRHPLPGRQSVDPEARGPPRQAERPGRDGRTHVLGMALGGPRPDHRSSPHRGDQGRLRQRSGIEALRKCPGRRVVNRPQILFPVSLSSAPRARGFQPHTPSKKDTPGTEKSPPLRPLPASRQVRMRSGEIPPRARIGVVDFARKSSAAPPAPTARRDVTFEKGVKIGANRM